MSSNCFSSCRRGLKNQIFFEGYGIESSAAGSPRSTGFENSKYRSCFSEPFSWQKHDSMYFCLHSWSNNNSRQRLEQLINILFFLKEHSWFKPGFLDIKQQNQQTKISHKTYKGQHNLSLIGTSVKHTQFSNKKIQECLTKCPFYHQIFLQKINLYF